MDNICRIPVRASYVIGTDGKAELKAAEYVDIPAELIAAKLSPAFKEWLENQGKEETS